MEKEQEQILVVPRGIVLATPWEGVKAVSTKEIEQLVREHGRFVTRGVPDQWGAESDPSLQQIIPYLVVSHQGRYFITQRGAEGHEVRLRNKISIGLGGHLNEGDVKDSDGKWLDLNQWWQREWEEEIKNSGAYLAEAVGLLNCDQSSVDRVHIGVVIRIRCSSPEISITDEHKSGRLATLAEIEEDEERMETWTKLVVAYLKENENGGR